MGDDLPEKFHQDHTVLMSSFQEKQYAKIQAEAQDATQKSAISFLHQLFGVCAHPALLENTSELNSLRDNPFPKGAKLISILSEIKARKEKAIIFAHRKLIQKWLVREIQSHFEITVSQPINGDITHSRKRKEIIERFSEKPGFGVLVLAPRAAGMGLNITAANHVIHYMREWNPAVENQASDRAYRIGQKKDVTIHTITTTSNRGKTVEKHLHELLESRRDLMNTFVIPMGGFDLTEDLIGSTEELKDIRERRRERFDVGIDLDLDGPTPPRKWLQSLFNRLYQVEPSTSGRHSVYLALLYSEQPGKDSFGVYVGMTGQPPEKRYRQHKSGEKASRHVTKYGIGLLTPYFKHLKNISEKEAGILEREIAMDLNSVGLWVEGGH